MRALFLLLCHPLSILFIFTVVDTYLNFSDLSLAALAIKSLKATQRAIMFSIVDAHVYGNWVFDVACICLVPIWLSLWFVLWHPLPPSQEQQENKNKKLKTS